MILSLFPVVADVSRNVTHDKHASWLGKGSHFYFIFWWSSIICMHFVWLIPISWINISTSYLFFLNPLTLNDNLSFDAHTFPVRIYIFILFYFRLLFYLFYFCILRRTIFNIISETNVFIHLPFSSKISSMPLTY